MSWFYKLCNLYDKLTAAGEDLAPVYFTPSSTPFEITLNEAGDFVSCDMVGQNDRIINIPITIKSEVRATAIQPRPLFDNLKYLAKDYDLLQLKTARAPGMYEAYMEQLKEWVDADGVHPAVPIIYKYIQKGTIVQDMLECGAIPRVPVKQEEIDAALAAGLPVPIGKPKTSITGASGSINTVCIRFRIAWEDPDKEPNIWRDKAFQQSWIDYEAKKMQEAAGSLKLCMGTGKMAVCSQLLPVHARSVSDRSHIISMNDDTGFSWKGDNFQYPDARCTVGLEETYKVVHTMRWLVQHNGIKVGKDTNIMLWTDEGALETKLTASDYTLLHKAYNLEHGVDLGQNPTDGAAPFVYPQCTQPELGKLLYNAIRRTNKNLSALENTYMLMVQGEKTGRLHILEYMEFSNSTLFNNMLEWHKNAVAKIWDYNNHNFIIKDVPLEDLAEYITGSVDGDKFVASDRHKGNCMQQLIHSKLYGGFIPYDYVNTLVFKTAKTHGVLSDGNWRRLMHATCCVINKYNYDTKKEEPRVSLDRECTDRSYLFGRLFALLQYMESAGRKEDSSKQNVNKEKQSILAHKLQSCVQAPATQTTRLYANAEGWLSKCKPGLRAFISKEWSAVSDAITIRGWNDTALDNTWLLGYSHEQQWLFTPRKGTQQAMPTMEELEGITKNEAIAETETADTVFEETDESEQLTLL